ncbi:MAG: hypothetical protein IPO83_17375 [Chitinophagaceae bacterium]|nr:hypothetical protein [Chitinophagaceae bacterium]
MNGKPILYTVAKDENGNLIKAKDAAKGIDFFCPICNSNIILRKSGKTGRNSKRPHFAHKAFSSNCSPESALHFVFKHLVAREISDHLSKNSPLYFSWKCHYCLEAHTDDLLKKIDGIKLEHDLLVCKPDIALFDEDNKVIAVIEIIVTHVPNEKTIKFYTDNSIVLIQINLQTDEDIELLKEKISNPDFVDDCLNPKCSNCGHFLLKARTMTIVSAPCWKCSSKMKLAIVNLDMKRGSTPLGPDSFSKSERAFARDEGVVLKWYDTKTTRGQYLANTCPHCNSFTGTLYLVTDFFSNASYPFETFDRGYQCRHCSQT